MGHGSLRLPNGDTFIGIFKKALPPQQIDGQHLFACPQLSYEASDFPDVAGTGAPSTQLSSADWFVTRSDPLDPRLACGPDLPRLTHGYQVSQGSIELLPQPHPLPGIHSLEELHSAAEEFVNALLSTSMRQQLSHNYCLVDASLFDDASLLDEINSNPATLLFLILHCPFVPNPSSCQLIAANPSLQSLLLLAVVHLTRLDEPSKRAAVQQARELQAQSTPWWQAFSLLVFSYLELNVDPKLLNSAVPLESFHQAIRALKGQLREVLLPDDLRLTPLLVDLLTMLSCGPFLRGLFNGRLCDLGTPEYLQTTLRSLLDHVADTPPSALRPMMDMMAAVIFGNRAWQPQEVVPMLFSYLETAALQHNLLIVYGDIFFNLIKSGTQPIARELAPILVSLYLRFSLLAQSAGQARQELMLLSCVSQVCTGYAPPDCDLSFLVINRLVALSQTDPIRRARCMVALGYRYLQRGQIYHLLVACDDCIQLILNESDEAGPAAGPSSVESQAIPSSSSSPPTSAFSIDSDQSLADLVDVIDSADTFLEDQEVSSVVATVAQSQAPALPKMASYHAFSLSFAIKMLAFKAPTAERTQRLLQDVLSHLQKHAMEGCRVGLEIVIMEKLGGIYSKLFERTKAMEFYHAAIDLYRQHSSTISHDFELMAATSYGFSLHMLGLSHWSVGATERAFLLAPEALLALRDARIRCSKGSNELRLAVTYSTAALNWAKKLSAFPWTTIKAWHRMKSEPGHFRTHYYESEGVAVASESELRSRQMDLVSFLHSFNPNSDEQSSSALGEFSCSSPSLPGQAQATIVPSNPAALARANAPSSAASPSPTSTVSAKSPTTAKSPAPAKSPPPSAPSTTAVVWVPDEQANDCFLCHKNFSLFIRRHHCRACGQVVCGDCSPPGVLPGYPSKQRVCLNHKEIAR